MNPMTEDQRVIELLKQIRENHLMTAIRMDRAIELLEQGQHATESSPQTGGLLRVSNHGR